MYNHSFLSLQAEEEPYILAVGAEGLWKQRLDSYGPGEFLYPHIRNISGKYYPNWALLHTSVIRSLYISSIELKGKSFHCSSPDLNVQRNIFTGAKSLSPSSFFCFVGQISPQWKPADVIMVTAELKSTLWTKWLCLQHADRCYTSIIITVIYVQIDDFYKYLPSC